MASTVRYVQLDREVLEKLYDVLLDGASIDDFEDWFVGETWDVRTTLVAEVTHLLVDRQVMDDDEVKDEIRAIVSTIVINDEPVRTESSSTTVTHDLAFAGT